MLQDGEKCVCDLQGDLDAAQSRLSFHLKVLRDAGLVSDRKDGRWSYYTIVPEALAELHDVVVSLQPSGRKSLPLSRSSGRCCN
jgi:ArsR family transcriptional regulator, arsenate/arsenite/antimonite-responsive transcriptional repressor